MSKNKHGGARPGAGRNRLNDEERKKGMKIYINNEVKDEIEQYGNGKTFSEKAVELIVSTINRRK